MTTVTCCFTFWATSIIFTKYFYLFCLLTWFFLQFSCPTNQSTDFGYTRIIFNALSISQLPAIHTLHIRILNLLSPIIWSERQCGAKKFRLLTQNGTPFLKSTRVYPSEYLDCVKLIIKQKECKILNGFWEISFNLFSWKNEILKMSKLSPQNLAFM